MSASEPLSLSDDEVLWLYGLACKRRKKAEKEHRKLLRWEDQDEEEFMDYVERKALSLRFYRGVEEKLRQHLMKQNPALLERREALRAERAART